MKSITLVLLMISSHAFADSFVGECNFQDLSFKTLSIVGPTTLKNVNIKQGLSIVGPAHLENSSAVSMSIIGNTELLAVRAHKISLTGKHFILKNTEFDELTILPNSNDDSDEQVIFYEGNSEQLKNVTFKGKNGKIVVSPR